MVRSHFSAIALALGLSACHPHGQRPAGATAPLEHHPITAGESNRFFVAHTARLFAFADGIRWTPVKDSAGHQQGFRLIAPDNGIATVMCECPASGSAGARSPVSSGCWTLGDSEESPHCWASCGAADASGASCGSIYWNGDATGLVKEPGGIALAQANGRKERTR